jgi:hypothetical protein
MISIGPRPYAGCTCTVCGTQWPDAPPTDGSDVFCDGLCQEAFRSGQATRVVFDPPPTWGVTYIATPQGWDEDQMVRAFQDFRDEFRDKLTAQFFVIADCPVIDLSPFDVPRGWG